MNKKWCMAGDWNDEFDESLSAGIAQLAGGKVVIRKDKDENTGTRWNSDREIDWWCTSDPYDVSNCKACNVKVADHKGVTVTLRTPNRKWKTGRLQKKPNYKKPEAISPEVWRTHLAEIWAKMTNSENRIKMKKCLVNKDEEADIEEEWQIFQGCVEECYQEAYKEALKFKWYGERDEEKIMMAQMDMKTRKGGEGDHKWQRPRKGNEATSVQKEQRMRKKEVRCEHCLK